MSNDLKYTPLKISVDVLSVIAICYFVGLFLFFCVFINAFKLSADQVKQSVTFIYVGLADFIPFVFGIFWLTSRYNDRLKFIGKNRMFWAFGLPFLLVMIRVVTDIIVKNPL